MDIVKIKHEDKKTIIVYQEDIDNGKIEKETTFKSDTERHEDFTNAAKEIIPLAVSILGLPQDYKDGIEFRGVSFSYNDHQGMGACVTMLKSIDGINSPFVMNTPHLHNAEEGDSIMPTAFRNQLEVLQKEAKEFLLGKRQQADMFYDKDAAKSKKEV